MTRIPSQRGARLRPDGPEGGYQLTLLGGFSLRHDGVEIELAPSAQRLLAFLALHRRHPRGYVASMLWPEYPQEQALASLRTALWRVRTRAAGTLSSTRHDLDLDLDVLVDVHRLAEVANHVIDSVGEDRPLVDAYTVRGILTAPGELLPGWYDDWVLTEREQTRLLHVRALEALADQLLNHHRPSSAVHAALTATTLEPFRDSAHAAVLRAYLSEGNTTEAIRHFQHYRSMLHRELGVEPSPALYKLVRPHLSGIVG
ncbi:AfsR/SARP family transcriptional regulator [Amycolatopsis rhizosphaerae]|nr:BTAD domain-containing putative transcriptional regulator [Amycolatopsis rhizosphaerae]